MTHQFFAQADMYSSDAAAASAAMALVVVLAISFIAAVAGYVIRSLALAKIFKKARRDEWRAWVPVYNQWVLLQLGGQAGWWSLLMFIPGVNLVAMVFHYIAMYHVGTKLGKDGVFVLLAIFLPIVWYIWLGFDRSVWNEENGAPRIDTPDTSLAAEEHKS